MGQTPTLSYRQISQLAERFGTPLYLYELEVLRRQVRRLQQALPDGAKA